MIGILFFFTEKRNDRIKEALHIFVLISFLMKKKCLVLKINGICIVRSLKELLGEKTQKSISNK